MKIKILFFVSLLVLIFNTGCVGVMRTIGVNASTSAGIMVKNNVADGYMTVTSSWTGPVIARARTGGAIWVPICDIPPQHRFTLTARFFDQNEKYLGMIEREFYISFDGSGRYGREWMVTSYQPPTRMAQR